MKILVFGKTGQVATELQGQADVVAIGREDANLTDPDQCVAAINGTDAGIVINAAAYTAVDKAETETDLAEMINHTTVAAMAKAAAERSIPFLHISTDYVFPGDGEAAWNTTDPTGPLGVYGATKLRGEQAVQNAKGQFAILRTSWVFSAHGNNFVKTMLRLGKERDALTIVADQIGGPTSAADIAAALIQMAASFHRGEGLSGVYHFSGAPNVSWAEFAAEIFAQADIDCAVTPIPTTDFPTPATRPLNSRLNCALTKSTFGIARPDWKSSLRDVLKELGEVK